MTTKSTTIDAIQRLQERVGERLSTEPQTIAEASADSSVRTKKALQAGHPIPLADAVLRPRDTEDVVEAVRWAVESGIPLVARGLGSGVVGSTVPDRGGVIVDFAGMTEIGEVDTVNRLVTVGPGTRLSDLDEALAPHGLSVGHYPQSFSLASVAGSIAMRGSGTFSSLHGNVEDRVADLQVVLTDGTVVQTRSMPRGAIGPDLKQLFVGSEGTLGLITAVTLRLVPLPEARIFASYRFPGFEAALATARRLLSSGVRPAVLRIYDPAESAAKHAGFAGADGWLMILVFDGAPALVDTQASLAAEFAADSGAEALGAGPAEDWERKRFDWSWFTDKVDQPGGIAEAIEISAPWSELPALYERLRTAVTEQLGEFMAHVSHVYDQGAALYTIVRGDFADDDEAMAQYDAVTRTVIEIALAEGARIAHHHGIGLERARWLPQELGNGFEILARVKGALDPNGILNPGKLGLGGATTR